METAGRESRKHPVNPERKYIRLQEIGMAHWLTWPVAMMLADMYHVQHIIPIMSVLLIYIGVVIFAIGYVGRQKLREQGQGQVDSDGKPKVM